MLGTVVPAISILSQASDHGGCSFVPRKQSNGAQEIKTHGKPTYRKAVDRKIP